MQRVTLSGRFHYTLNTPVQLEYSWHVHSVNAQLDETDPGVGAEDADDLPLSGPADTDAVEPPPEEAPAAGGGHSKTDSTGSVDALPSAIDKRFCASGITRGVAAASACEPGAGASAPVPGDGLPVEGVFAKAGTYEVYLCLDGLRQEDTGRALPVDDYAFCAPVTVVVSDS